MNKLLLFCFLILTPVSLASADLKIAVIDFSKAIEGYYKTSDAQAHLDDKKTRFIKDLQDMTADYDNKVKEFSKLQDDANNTALAPDARDAKKKALETLAQELRTKSDQLQEAKTEKTHELEEEFTRRHADIVKDISKVISDYSEPAGYDLVIDKSSASANTGAANVLYSSSRLTDITQDIIKQLNATRPAAGTTTPAAGATTPPAH